MKKILIKIKDFFKWILHNIKYVGIVIGALFIMMCVKRIVAKIGRVGNQRYWDPVPGDKTKVYVWDKDSNRRVVVLPVDPRTDKQITNNEIKTIGLPVNSEDEGELYVEILHTPVNRK